VTALAVVVAVATGVVAIVDWAAVAMQRRSVEYAAKPLTTIGLVVLALAINPASSGARAFFVVALVFSLAGDVLLMLPDRQRFFVFGLASFLVAHVLYIPGLILLGAALAEGSGSTRAVAVGVGAVVVAVGIAVVGLPVVRGARTADVRLTVPVAVYLSVISAMVLTAFASLVPLAIAGAMVFYLSDAVLGTNEFVAPRKWGHLAVMVTYHLGQAGLVLSLVAW